MDVKAYFPTIKAKLAQDVKVKSTATFLCLRLTKVNKEYEATPIHGGSGRLITLVNSNSFAIIPKGKSFEKGSLIDTFFYDRYEFA